jgi:hypothetical protein
MAQSKRDSGSGTSLRVSAWLHARKGTYRLTGCIFWRSRVEDAEVDKASLWRGQHDGCCGLAWRVREPADVFAD